MVSSAGIYSIQHYVSALVSSVTVHVFQTSRITRKKIKIINKYIYIENIYTRYNNRRMCFFSIKEISANSGFFMIVHTFIMSLTISTFADRVPGYSKELALFSRFVSLIFLFWLMLMLNFHARMTTSNNNALRFFF